MIEISITDDPNNKDYSVDGATLTVTASQLEHYPYSGSGDVLKPGDSVDEYYHYEFTVGVDTSITIIVYAFNGEVVLHAANYLIAYTIAFAYHRADEQIPVVVENTVGSLTDKLQSYITRYVDSDAVGTLKNYIDAMLKVLELIRKYSHYYPALFTKITVYDAASLNEIEARGLVTGITGADLYLPMDMLRIEGGVRTDT